MLTNQMAENDAWSFHNYDNEHESTEHAMGNYKHVSSSTITQGDWCDNIHEPVKQFASIPYDHSNEMYDDANDFDFDCSYQPSFFTFNYINPNEAFKDVFGYENIQLLLIMISVTTQICGISHNWIQQKKKQVLKLMRTCKRL